MQRSEVNDQFAIIYAWRLVLTLWNYVKNYLALLNLGGFFSWIRYYKTIFETNEMGVSFAMTIVEILWVWVQHKNRHLVIFSCFKKAFQYTYFVCARPAENTLRIRWEYAERMLSVFSANLPLRAKSANETPYGPSELSIVFLKNLDCPFENGQQ